MNSIESHIKEINHLHNRRTFLKRAGLGLGALGLASLVNPLEAANPTSGFLLEPHFSPKVKRVIYLFQSGGPSQIESFDYKPKLNEMFGQDLPESIRQGQRLTGMSANQSKLPLVGSKYSFKQYGQSGTWVSDQLPYTAEIADEICVVKSVYTEAINHDPAITFFQTGAQKAGRPSIGAWLSYGLGSDNENLPAFIVLVTKNKGGQPLYSRLWGNGFLPSSTQGVQFRAGKDAVLFLNNPEGMTDAQRRAMLERLKDMYKAEHLATGDPSILSKIAQYEMAYRMQSSVPDVMDVSKEPDWVYEMYGEDARNPGTFAANCLLARRLAEKGVKFIQLYHQGWDHHGGLPFGFPRQCKDVDQASAALVKDLKQRGMLEDTLVVWGGEFGRTNYCQGKLQPDNYGRDHHPRCFSMWMAGGGIKPGISYGETDDFSYNITKDPVHVHDFQATLLHLLGIDHERLTYKHQGRRYRLTDVHGNVVHGILS